MRKNHPRFPPEANDNKRHTLSWWGIAIGFIIITAFVGVIGVYNLFN